jgi:catechol 2,3-dioxygenase-like lactoylglutathione lyase family enzyme
MTTRITAVHPVLAARDVNESLAFCARLGFVAIFTDDPVRPRYAAVRRGAAGQWTPGGDRPVVRFPTPDPDALYAEFLAAGAITTDSSGGPYALPADTPWGTREFHLRDPGGNGLQFYRARGAG